MNRLIFFFFTLSFISTAACAQPKNISLQSASGFDSVRKVVNAAIADSAFPAATVAVLYRDSLVFHEGFGRLTYSAAAARADTNTIYDLASLTKVLCTTTSIMRLYDDGKLKLDDPVSKFIPEFAANGKDSLTIRNLLLHNSGLVAFRPYEKTCFTANAMLTAIYGERLLRSAGDTTIYSDLNFIVLGEVVRRITGKRLDMYFRDTFIQPLDLTTMQFFPLQDSLKADSLKARLAPVEFDSGWKSPPLPVRALVHDPRAALQGGVSGHAGLFSTASDAARLMQVLMQGGKAQGKVYLKPQTVSMFVKRQSSKSTRALGWDTRSADEKAMTGKYFSAGSYGHSGYTGTSIWVDPVRNLCVVFFTNRVYPTSANNKIRAVRRLLHDAVIESLGHYHVPPIR